MLKIEKIGYYNCANEKSIQRWLNEKDCTVIETSYAIYTIAQTNIQLPFSTDVYEVKFKKRYPDGKTIKERRKAGVKTKFVRGKYNTLTIEEKLMRRYLGIAECGAKYRNISYSSDINIKFSLKLLNNQNYKCAISGVPISLENKTASLDRIDSNKDYTVENVQWVHKIVNLIKGSLSKDEFDKWINTIYQYNYRHNLS